MFSRRFQIYCVIIVLCSHYILYDIFPLFYMLEARHKPRQEEDEIRGIPISDEKLGADEEVVGVLAYGVEVTA